MELTVDDRVRAVVRAELGFDADAPIGHDATFTELGADSSDSYSLVLALEDEFGIEIPDHDVPQLQTVRAVVCYVTARAGIATA